MSGESGAGKTESTKLLLRAISCALMPRALLSRTQPPPVQADGSDFLCCVRQVLHALHASAYITSALSNLLEYKGPLTRAARARASMHRVNAALG